MTRDHKKFENFIKNFWHYYIQLENEFLETRKYVEISEDNFSTYSLEYLKLYQALCSEIDVIGKAMAVEVNSNFKPSDAKNNIYKWWYEIQDEFKVHSDYADINNAGISLSSFSVTLLDSVEIIPWKDFRITPVMRTREGQRWIEYRTINGKGSPKWWGDYNKVKHNRAFAISKTDPKKNYTKANLGNVCNAIAGLHILEASYMECIGTKNDLQAFMEFSKLFDKQRLATDEDIDNILNEAFGDSEK